MGCNEVCNKKKKKRKEINKICTTISIKSPSQNQKKEFINNKTISSEPSIQSNLFILQQRIPNNRFKSNLNFENIKNIKDINCNINSISIFPLGNCVTVSNHIKIWDINFNIIQIINNPHNNDKINYVSVKDDNNFITCSYDIIKTWIKNENNFIINKIISQILYLKKVLLNLIIKIINNFIE